MGSNNSWAKAKRRAIRQRGFEIATSSANEANALLRLLAPPQSPRESKDEMRDAANDSVAAFLANGGSIKKCPA